MKALLDARALQPQMDGIGRYASTICTKLSSRRPDWSFEVLVAPGSSRHIAGGPNLAVSESPVARFGPDERRRMTPAVRTVSPAVIHNFSVTGPVWRGIPGSFTVHDLIVIEVPGFFGPSRIRNTLARKWFSLLISRGVREASSIAVPTEWVRQRLCERFPAATGKTVVTYEGQDLFDPRDGRPAARGDFLLYIGNARPYKNLPRLLRAYAALVAGGSAPPLRMVVKRDRALTLLEREIETLGLREHIDLVSGVTDDEMRKLYMTCRAFVFPSIYEGFGLPVLEAMACGCPVLTSRGTAVEEVAGDGALLVDPTSVDAIRSGLEEICSRRDLREELSLRALSRASMFSWDASAEITARMLEDMAGGRTRNLIRT
jgi:glycosyltransferase involved in cell wall biosynthesis